MHNHAHFAQQVIADTLEGTRGTSVAKITGMATDGASAFTGKQNGAIAHLKVLNPVLTNVHCVAHRENLAVAASCASVPIAAETDTILTEVRCPCILVVADCRARRCRCVNVIMFCMDSAMCTLDPGP